MNPILFALATFTFSLSMLLHILVWRLKRPDRHALALLILFLVPPSLVLSAAWLGNSSVPREDLLAAGLLHLALSFAYIQIYPASQADSPSLKLMRLVQQRMPHGISEEEIRTGFDSSQLFSDRIEDLLKAGLIQKEGDDLLLTAQGRSLILPFILIRKWIGSPPGKG